MVQTAERIVKMPTGSTWDLPADSCYFQIGCRADCPAGLKFKVARGVAETIKEVFDMSEIPRQHIEQGSIVTVPGDETCSSGECRYQDDIGAAKELLKEELDLEI